MINTATIATPAADFLPLGKILACAARQLTVVGIESAALEAALLLQFATGLTREQLVTESAWIPPAEAVARFESFVARRKAFEPVAYITGHQEFWSLDFLVTPAVLIPRPETERLVEIALAATIERGRAEAVKILDLGAGSGAMAVSLATELPFAAIYASDLSTAALQVARVNAERNGVGAKIQFYESDCFAGLGGLKFDFILSNPPYIARGDLPTLQPDVYHWEPVGALDGGDDGLEFYRRIAAEATSYLEPGGEVVVEIGADQGSAAIGLFAQAGFAATELLQDYAGRDRVVRASQCVTSRA